MQVENKNTISLGFGLRSSSYAFVFIGFLVLLLIDIYPIFDFTKVLAQSTEESNINMVRQVAEAFNTGNVSNVTEFISPQYFNHESQVDPIRGQLRGPEEFIDTVENLRTAFPNLNHNEQQIIAEDDTVVSVLNVTGTNTGNFFILPPTGKNISYEAVHIYRIGEDGKIVEHKAIRDDLTFLAQLGVVKPSSANYEPFFQVLTGYHVITQTKYTYLDYFW
jgi:nogalonic acid methyl ester cyclase / aklanonic acid methyl ester cyclase